MSRPSLQQGQSHVISQAYSALLALQHRGLVESELHEVSSYCHALQEKALGNDAVTVTESEEVCLRRLWR
ncbi:hypothetical protein PBY51_014499 [Eleginops maclovinus]|uniref:Uncharacterized protein n=1 Tax=Eleginops maclovinus TaxID=56733 RepID=A0AAN7WN78_ELEMC|nr:hypothetical protein PBY51_014499 [Eleginops maclovinus]